MKIVQIFNKPVNSEVMVDLKNIESPVMIEINHWLVFTKRKTQYLNFIRIFFKQYCDIMFLYISKGKKNEIKEV